MRLNNTLMSEVRLTVKMTTMMMMYVIVRQHFFKPFTLTNDQLHALSSIALFGYIHQPAEIIKYPFQAMPSRFQMPDPETPPYGMVCGLFFLADCE